MSEAHRSDLGPAEDAPSATDRDAKIEQLLLLGLDHYFSARYELAINVWTRVLFIDRSHARARAYIDRARSALAERQRESEELLQNGVAAFHRGESDEARRLLQAAIDGGAPSEEALAVLERLNRLETAGSPVTAKRADRVVRTAVTAPGVSKGRSRVWRAVLGVFALAALLGAGAFVFTRSGVDLRSAFGIRSVLALTSDFTSAEPTASTPLVREVTLVLPRRGEMILANARALVASGHLREALTALETVRPTDPQRGDADRLRGEIQRQLIALATLPTVPAPPRSNRDGHVP